MKRENGLIHFVIHVELFMLLLWINLISKLMGSIQSKNLWSILKVFVFRFVLLESISFVVCCLLGCLFVVCLLFVGL